MTHRLVAPLVPLALALAACPRPVQPPVADGDGPPTVAVGAYARFDGSKSSDPNNPTLALSYRWTIARLPAGSQAKFNDPGSVTPSFKADVACVSPDPCYLVELRVSNGVHVSAPKEFPVTAGPCGANPPTITDLKATPDAPAVGQAVLLSAKADSPDNAEPCKLGKTLSWAWSIVSQPAGSLVELSTPSARSPWFRPDLAGDYAVELAVTDSGSLLTRQEVKVTAGPCGAQPIGVAFNTPAALNTGPAVFLQAVPKGTTGSGQAAAVATVDNPNEVCGQGGALAYRWWLATRPAGSSATLAAADTSQPWFAPDATGDYTVGLAVTDARGHTGAATVTLAAGPCGTHAPQISFSTPLAVNTTEMVTLGVAPANANTTAVATITDANDACNLTGTLSYQWTLVSAPPGSQAAISYPTSATPFFRADVPGSYSVRLTATDATRNAGSATVAIDVAICGSNTPTVSFGSAQPVNTGGTVSLEAVVSPATPTFGMTASATVISPNAACNKAGTVRFAWSLVQQPANSASAFNQAASATPSFIADVPGTYLIELAATDGTGNTGTGRVTVTAGACGSLIPQVTFGPVNPVSVGQLVTVEALLPGQTAQAGTAAQATVTEPNATCATGPTRLGWSLVSLPNTSQAALVNATSATPTFTPDVPGPYVIEILATDAAGKTGAGRVTVSAGTCGSQSPAVTFGTVNAVNTGQTVTLEAVVGAQTPQPGMTAVATVTNPNSACVPGSMRFSWSVAAVPATSRTTLTNAGSATPTFTPDAPGTYQLVLTATDGAGRSGAQVVSVVVGSCGSAAPTVGAIAFSPSPAATSQTIVMSAAVTDADTSAPCSQTEAFTYLWAFTSIPAGSAAVISSSTSASASFVPDLPGSYSLVLSVTDSAGHTTRASASLSVALCTPPTALVATTSPVAAGPAASLTVSALTGTPVQMDGAASSPSSCRPAATLQYAWSLVRAPAGFFGSLSSTTRQNPSLNPTVAGQYLVTLVVRDSVLSSAAATLTINARAALSTTVDAGGEMSSLALHPTTGRPSILHYDTGVGELRLADCASDCDTAPLWSLSVVDGFVGDPLAIGGVPGLTGATGGGATGAPRPTTIAFRSDGTTAVSYFSDSTCTLRYRARPPGGAFTAAITVAGTGCGGIRTGLWASMAISPTTDRPGFAFWRQSVVFTETLYYAECNNAASSDCYTGAATFTAVAVTAATNVGRWASLRYTATGEPRIAYFDEATNDLMFAQCSGGCTAGGWSTGPIVATGDVGRYVTLAVGPNGNHVAYRNETTGTLEYATCNVGCIGGTGNWSRTLVDFASCFGGTNVGRHTSIALDSVNNLARIIYNDVNCNWLKLASFSPAAGWTVATLDGPTTFSVGAWGSLTLSANNTPRVSHFDTGGGGRLKFFSGGP